MLASSLFALALAAVGANAIQVTYPTKRDTWSTSGAQTIEWDSVSTDPSNFAIILVNQDSSYLSKSTTLSDKVSTSDGKISVSFPSGNFPAGQSFQVNFVRVDQDDTILAQSDMFDIVQSAATTTTTAAQTTTAATTTTAAGTTTTANSLPKTLSNSAASAASSAASAASAAVSGASESGGVSIPAGNTSTGGALSSFSASTVLIAVAGAVGAAALL